MELLWLIIGRKLLIRESTSSLKLKYKGLSESKGWMQSLSFDTTRFRRIARPSCRPWYRMVQKWLLGVSKKPKKKLLWCVVWLCYCQWPYLLHRTCQTCDWSWTFPCRSCYRSLSGYATKVSDYSVTMAELQYKWCLNLNWYLAWQVPSKYSLVILEKQNVLTGGWTPPTQEFKSVKSTLRALEEDWIYKCNYPPDQKEARNCSSSYWRRKTLEKRRRKGNQRANCERKEEGENLGWGPNLIFY